MRNKHLLLLVFLSFSAINLQATVFTSVQDGPWDAHATWGIPITGDLPVVSGTWPGDEVTIAHNVTFTGNLTTGQMSNVFINNGGNLAVSGNLTIANSNPSTFTLSSGGTLSAVTLRINGSSNTTTLDGTVNVMHFIYSSSNSVSIGGDINTSGNFTADGSGTVNFTGGNVNISGDLTISNGPVNFTGGNVNISGDFTAIGGVTANLDGVGFTVAGTTSQNGSSQINIDGGTNAYFGALTMVGAATINGIGTGGTFGYSSISLQNSSTAITCISGAGVCRYDATTAPPPNPLDLSTGAMVPVRLLFFEAYLDNNNDAVLSWSTSEEINNNYFEVEYSTDGRTFESVAQINGKGLSTEIVNYTWVDRHTTVGENYYRLWQYDFDGNNRLLGLKVVQNNQPSEKKQVSPNPCYSGQLLAIDGNTANIDAVKLISITGQSWSLSTNRVPGSVQLPDNLQAGLYYLQIIEKTDAHLLPVIIQGK